MSLIGRTKVKEKLIGNTHLIDKIDGYSAYEIAVKHGFKGSEEEWLASIKGEKGDKGDAAPFEATDLTGTDTDIDKINAPGFYYGKDVKNSPFGYMHLEVRACKMGGAGTMYYQEIIDLQTGETAIRYTRARPMNFTGVEWEYENPDPVWLAGNGYGQVVKTTERFWGKPVYTTVVFFEDFENGKEVNITGDAVDENNKFVSGIYGYVIRHNGYLYSSGGEIKTLPYIYQSTDDIKSAWLSFDTLQQSGAKIKMRMHGFDEPVSGGGAKNGRIQIWFVKDM